MIFAAFKALSLGRKLTLLLSFTTIIGATYIYAQSRVDCSKAQLDVAVAVNAGNAATADQVASEVVENNEDVQERLHEERLLRTEIQTLKDRLANAGEAVCQPSERILISIDD